MIINDQPAVHNSAENISFATDEKYNLPLMPARPVKCLQDKETTEEMVNSALAYNPSFLKSYVYLNEQEAHSRSGDQNKEVLARITRTFIDRINDEDWVVAEVVPQRKYSGGKLAEICDSFGSHPGRSIDLWTSKIVPGCKTPYYLMGIALTGSQRAAVPNLPEVYYSVQTGANVVTFSVNTGLQQPKVEQLLAELPVLPSFERQRLILMSTAFTDEMLQGEIAELRRLYSRPKSAEEAIQRFATENDLNLTIQPGREFALHGAKRKWPECFRGQQINFSTTPDTPGQPRNANEAMQCFALENNIEIKTMDDFLKGRRQGYEEMAGVI